MKHKIKNTPDDKNIKATCKDYRSKYITIFKIIGYSTRHKLFVFQTSLSLN